MSEEIEFEFEFETEIVPFTPECVKAHLDACIEFWRKAMDDFAPYYVDAYQSIRSSLFGETLPKEDDHD